MNSHTQPSGADTLSPVGQQRRDAMLGSLIDEMQTHHRRRRTRRHVVASSMLVMMVIGLSALIQNSWRSATRVAAPKHVASEVSNAAPRSIIEIVTTDESLVNRLRSVSTSKADWLDDQTLLTALTNAGRPTGIIRTEGRTWLTSIVVDPIAQPTGGM